jgi:hypothetical protein
MSGRRQESVYTPTEFDEMKKNTIFMKKILSEGKLLYEV